MPEYVSTFRLLRIFIEDGEEARLRFETTGRKGFLLVLVVALRENQDKLKLIADWRSHIFHVLVADLFGGWWRRWSFEQRNFFLEF